MNQLFGHSTDPGDSDLGTNSVPVRPLPVPGAEQAFFHLEIKRSLRMHWRLARNVAIGGVVAAVAYFLVQSLVLRSWPAFVAESMVFVEPVQSKVYEAAQGGSPRWPYDNNTYESFIQQQMMNVTRNDVLASALKKIGDFQQHGESQQAAAQRLAQALTVTREGNAYTFSIGARAGTAEFAADIANDVTTAYLESIRRDLRAGDSQRLAMLTDEKDRVGKALDADRAEQEALNKQLGVASVGSTVPDHFDEDITSTRSELVKARIDHDAAEAKFSAYDAGHGPSSTAIDAAADEIIASDAGLVSMKTSLNQRRATIISQMANLTPSHPQYKQDEVELGKINNELDSMMRDLRSKAAARIQLQLQSELQRTAGVESQVNGQLRRLVGSAGSATPKMQRASDLASDITRLQARYASVDEQVHNLMLEDNAPASAHQVSPAVPPLSRTKTGVLRNVFLIAFAGLVFGVLAAIVANKLDPKIYIARDVEMVLGFPPMAQLPDFSQVSNGVGDEYLLRLASSIEHARKQSHLRSCVFTGTSSGNGVSLIVSRVGGMLEAMGRSTVLVDASGAPAPETHHPESPADNSLGLVPVDHVSRPTALLQQMVEGTETQNESLVLTDTAPLPVSAETQYLARFVDCVIVVVESGKTTRRELRKAAETLQRLDVAAVGFVLNRVGLETANPAFRDSVQAIEKHLEAQKLRQAAYRAEASRSLPSQIVWEAPEPLQTEPHADDNPSRAHFEAEAAAASAAVARLSHPLGTHPETEASLPSPMAPVPVAESAARFSAPLFEEQVAEVVPHEIPLPVPEVPAPEPEPPVAHVAPPVAPAPLVAPFLEAAHQVFASLSGHPVSHTSDTERALFAALGGSFAAPETVAHTPAAPVTSYLEPEPEPYKLLFTHAEPETPASAPQEQDSAHLDAPLEAPFELPSAHEIAEPAFVADEKPEFSLADFLKAEPPVDTDSQVNVEPSVYAESQLAAEAPATEGFSVNHHLVTEHVLEPVVAEAALQTELPHQEEAAPEPEPIAAAVEAIPEPVVAPEVSETPWWIGEAGGMRAAKRPPVIWKPAKVRMSVPLADHAAPSQPSAANGSARPATPQAWDFPRTEQGSSVHSAPRPDVSFSSDQEEGSEPLSSRLSGLRSLLFVLGVKEGQDAVSQPEDQAADHSNPDVITDRQASPTLELEDRNDVSPVHIGGASPKLVTAPPEFLAPKHAPITPGREPAPASQAYVHLERRPLYEGVDILPSQKGQYKKI